MPKSADRGLLLPGEYQWPHDRSHAYRLFFDAIQRLSPEVLQSLRDDVLPVFCMLSEAATHPPLPTDDLLMGNILGWAQKYHLVGSEHNSRTGSGAEKLRAPLRGAAKDLDPNSFPPDMQFFLNWVLFAAYGTLKVWASEGDGTALAWTLPRRGCQLGLILDHEHLDRAADELFSDLSEGLPEYQFHCASWDPQCETRPACIDRILAEVKRQLEPMLDKEENTYQFFGFERTPRLTAKEHFDWLVRYQVQGVRFQRIGRESAVKRETQTIADGVKDAAEHVIGPGWQTWLRPGRPGRPHKV